MTQAAQAAAKEVADMLKLDDKTDQPRPKPQQSKLSPEEQEFFNQKAPGEPDDNQEGQSDSGAAPSNEQSAEASTSDEQPSEEPQQADVQPSEVSSDNCKFKVLNQVRFRALNPVKKPRIRPFFRTFS